MTFANWKTFTSGEQTKVCDRNRGSIWKRATILHDSGPNDEFVTVDLGHGPEHIHKSNVEEKLL